MIDKELFQETLEAVTEINEIISEYPDYEEFGQFLGLDFNTDGSTVFCVNFMNFHIWDSENDIRETYDSGRDEIPIETMKQFLLKETIKIIDFLTNIKTELESLNG